MNFKDLKYLIAYITPLIGWFSLINNGWWSFAAVIFMFGLVPIIDGMIVGGTSNHPPEKESARSAAVIFDILLYLNLPVLYLLIWKYFSIVSLGGLASLDLIGKTLSIGFIAGAIGINVAHEIGHRPERYNQWISRLLLLPELYLHFNIEHNRGHHKWVATPNDPATSRYGETFYRFWVRTVIGSMKSAWKIATNDVVKRGGAKYGLSNQMVQFTLIQLCYLAVIGVVFGLHVVPWAIALAMLGFTLLESVNYIEHYGLMRKKLASGRYEPVQPHHSWNSDHEFGRILLYELTRHSDHHFKATRKYQVLRHFEESPQMKIGYPASMLLALFPPLWFKMMHSHPSLAKAA